MVKVSERDSSHALLIFTQSTLQRIAKTTTSESYVEPVEKVYLNSEHDDDLWYIAAGES
jgi:hypothetical protein